jgi:hypothetical protein
MLANFTRVLQERKAEIGYHQVWRYTQAGRLPKLNTWLLERPELAEALAADARALAGSERAIVSQERG